MFPSPDSHIIRNEAGEPLGWEAPEEAPYCDQCGVEHVGPCQWDDDYDERACIICDGIGHAYIVGWREDPHKGTVPIIGGGPCPLEEPGGWEPDEDDRF